MRMTFLKNDTFEFVNRYLFQWTNSDYINKKYTRFKSNILQMENIFENEISRIINTQKNNKNGLVLDLGCGDGSFTDHVLKFAKINPRGYFGIDCNKISLKNHIYENAAKFKIKLINEDFNEFHTKYFFNYIFAFNSFYGLHFEKIENYLKCLAPGGMFIILLNDKNGLFNLISQKIGNNKITSNNLEIYLAKNNIKYKSFKLNYIFPDVKTVEEIQWLSYLYEDKIIDDQALMLYNKNRIEYETVFLLGC